MKIGDTVDLRVGPYSQTTADWWANSTIIGERMFMGVLYFKIMCLNSLTPSEVPSYELKLAILPTLEELM
jgi:hypothetical protein